MAVSVERFIHDNPALFKATAGFVALFRNLQDPVVAVTRLCKTIDEKVGWVLLGTALFQNCSYVEFAALMRALHEKFPGDALWKLPVPKEEDINRCVESIFNTRSWPLYEHAAGIFWSVGVFMRNHGTSLNSGEGLAAYIASRTPEELWRDLGEIYFMGKSNPRPKACAAIYRLITETPIGLGLHSRSSLKQAPLPLTMGARRYISILGPASSENSRQGFAELEPKEKQNLANQLYVALGKEGGFTPYLSSHGLQYFLENGKEGFICRQLTDHCKKCPLYEFCNYSENSSKGKNGSSRKY